ncbi:hypothetical protein ASPVEDRAFT_31523 [Aspergillus versicolor CBS 583.65]|uniref:Uncharacterized protein n=1 Tax=Aspergillus versicolor CBS 583.65 TaxID=1036611 RepID=A0A1L9PU78_ASPVE|nr:uncharacterized protein ASPVEDRAFT_31523 [Aspergillus versicolor CBS 583.65]OJJ05110.1 hypothetical protein ASPVEDRAFT_31523 [Aspergillus versicolor CBS 583.65]
MTSNTLPSGERRSSLRDTPARSENVIGTGDRNTMMCEAEIQALRTHVSEMQTTLTSTARGVAQQSIALWDLQRDNKGLDDRLSALTEAQIKSTIASAEEQIEIGILKARVDALEMERAEGEGLINVFKKHHEDVMSQLARADMAMKRQQQQFLRLATVRYNDQLDYFPVSGGEASHDAGEQDQIHAPKQHRRTTESRPRRKGYSKGRPIRDAHNPDHLGRKGRSKGEGEAPRRIPIQSRPRTKHFRPFDSPPSV